MHNLHKLEIKNSHNVIKHQDSLWPKMAFVVYEIA